MLKLPDPNPVFLLVATNVIIVQLLCCVSTDEFQTVNIGKLSKLEHGTELVVLEPGYNDRKAYRLEDFFWTGSGDDNSEGDDEKHWRPDNSDTEYKTKTVLSTIYIEPPSTHITQTQHTTNCPSNCDAPVTPNGEIVPTPTYNVIYKNNTEENVSNTDRHFWLVTVLKSDGKDVVLTELKNNLAKLYQIAFQRQQERHLGINGRSKRDTTKTEQPVHIYIHNVAKSPINGEEKIEVLYHVSVAGQPVAATTAAADMHLISDEEVTNELGYPFIIKAEPYIKVGDPQYLSSANNTWIFIGVALTMLFILLLLVALLTLALSKHSKSQMGLANKKQVFREDIRGHPNEGFVSNDADKREYGSGKHGKSSTYINLSKLSHQTLRSGAFVPGTQSTSSSSSFSISSLEDTSPLMSLKKRQHTPKKNNITRPKAALNKTTPTIQEQKIKLGLDSSDSSTSKNGRDSSDTILIQNYDPGVVSPKSYLSMPSVKSFPRGNIPEPLNKVLEPVSVLHLDIADEENLYCFDQKRKKCNLGQLTRHGSLSAIEDPGVIGPIVWSAYCKKLEQGASIDPNADDIKISNNASRMRKRFHDLLDETFSLFGSRRESPVEEGRPVTLEVKSHSALTNRNAQESQLNIPVRPRTSGAKRSIPENEPPRRAWATNAPSPLSRPLSAGPFHRTNIDPEINVDRVLTEGSLALNDPAVPLIAAIKTELDKCSLPGSTSNLVE